MDQQRSAIVKHYEMFQLSASVPNFLSLNRHWSIVWSMTVCWMPDPTSFKRRLNSSVSRTEFQSTRSCSTAQNP